MEGNKSEWYRDTRRAIKGRFILDREKLDDRLAREERWEEGAKKSVEEESRKWGDGREQRQSAGTSRSSTGGILAKGGGPLGGEDRARKAGKRARRGKERAGSASSQWASGTDGM
ncbi:hypothetical protein KM043_004070 [Ampulex compressa]|nr:hypothetical protein KM043_004070 [Ampulex compressa]